MTVTPLWRHNGVTIGAERNGRMMKERRVRCKECGERFTIVRFDRERISLYCEVCRAERRREQTRQRMHELRIRRRLS